MNSFLRQSGLRLLIAATAIAAFLTASAQVPTQLIPPAGNVEVLRLHGDGVQIYVSTPNPSNPSQFVWTFTAPSADLSNNGGHSMGSHYVGPTWEANNGSLVKGTKIAGVTVDSSAIPWLLLRGRDWAGHGMFSEVTYIQRLDTVGGLAPSWTPTAAGIEVDVHYTATYVFFEAISPRS
jgi:hypothetical protein